MTVLLFAKAHRLACLVILSHYQDHQTTFDTVDEVFLEFASY